MNVALSIGLSQPFHITLNILQVQHQWSTSNKHVEFVPLSTDSTIPGNQRFPRRACLAARDLIDQLLAWLDAMVCGPQEAYRDRWKVDPDYFSCRGHMIVRYIVVLENSRPLEQRELPASRWTGCFRIIFSHTDNHVSLIIQIHIQRVRVRSHNRHLRLRYIPRLWSTGCGNKSDRRSGLPLQRCHSV